MVARALLRARGILNHVDPKVTVSTDLNYILACRYVYVPLKLYCAWAHHAHDACMTSQTYNSSGSYDTKHREALITLYHLRIYTFAATWTATNLGESTVHIYGGGGGSERDLWSFRIVFRCDRIPLLNNYKDSYM